MLTRRKRGKEIFEHFEAMAVIDRQFGERHGMSLYPRGRAAHRAAQALAGPLNVD
ncbi:MAG: hypothetical protein M3Y18_04710 [Candidatus Eremiobacteraeota bacterium]|nr:hypothetical protein [Candidatus Eremiobacteraeota bacterium]